MKEINIYIFTNDPWYEYSGWRKQTETLIAELKKIANSSFQVITFGDELENKNVAYRVKNVSRGEINRIKVTLKYINLFFSERKKIDVIYLPKVHLTVLPLIIFGRLLGSNIITRISGAEVFGKGLKNRLKLFVLKFSNYCIALNNETVEILKNYSINALYIPNAVDTKRFNSKHTSINETIGNFVLCTFGSVCKRKRVDVAIKVVASLKEKGIPVLLKIIGPTEGFGEYEEEYLDYIKNFISVNELDDSVQFLGMVDKPELELKQCDVLLFPSESEGMPNALLEAMACGVVPISNAIPGTEEIIHNDENGFLVKENNLEQYISHCLELYNDKSRLFELSEKAVDFIRNHHDKTVIYKKYRKLFT